MPETHSRRRLGTTPTDLVRRWLELGEPGGDVHLGVWLQTGSHEAAEIAGAAGYSYAVIDTEHAALDVSTVDGMLAACRAAGLPALVRLPMAHGSTARLFAQQALDSGAVGVIVPRCEDPEDIRALVNITEYPPDGSRGVCPRSVAGSYGVRWNDYREAWSSVPPVWLLIETVGSVDRLDEMLIPGVGGAFGGPLDLAHSMGLDPDDDSAMEKVWRELQEVGGRVRDSGRNFVPVLASNAPIASLQPRVQEWKQAGYKLLSVGSDRSALAASFQEVVSRFSGDSW